MVKAHPTTGASTHFRVRHDKVHETGNVTLRYGSRLHHVGIPRALAGEVVSILVADRDVRVLNMDGELIRHFELDPTRDYQPLSLGPALKEHRARSKAQAHDDRIPGDSLRCLRCLDTSSPMS